MLTNNHASSPEARADDAAPQPQYMVIVHPAGPLDDRNATSFWTEVPAFSACCSGGATPQQAVENTRIAITTWLRYVAEWEDSRAALPATHTFGLIVERAF